MAGHRTLVVLMVTSALLTAPSLHSQGPLDPDWVPVAPVGPQPQFRSGAVLVPIDVRVVDKKGQAVTDLTASDFTVLENGVPQRVAHFAFQQFEPEARPTETASPAGLPRAANAFEMASPNRRTFLILLGRGLLQEPSKGVDAMIHLVRDVAMPQDYVAVMAWNRATDFTTDRERLIDILERFKQENVGIEYELRLWEASLARVYGDGRIPKYIQARIDAVFGGSRAPGVRTMEADEEMASGPESSLRRIARGLLEPNPSLDPVDAYMADFYGGTLDEVLRRSSSEIRDRTSLLMAIEQMRLIAGHKQVMFVSEYGFSSSQHEDILMLGRRAADARVAMNFIHAGGMWTVTSNIAASRARSLPTLSAGFDRNILTGQDARTITSLSGGQFFAHKHYDSAKDVDLMNEASRSVYTLGFYPAHDPVDGKYRRLQVKVSRPGVTVLARDGYYARANVGPAEMKSAIVLSRVRGAAGRSFTIPDIGINDLTITSRPGPSRQATVSMSIDLSRVYFEKKAGMNVASLDVAVFVVTNGDRDAGRMWHTLALSYTDERLDQMRGLGLLHESVVTLTAAPQGVKVVVYDYASDLLGSAIARVSK
jgi:VWFA-related protein